MGKNLAMLRFGGWLLFVTLIIWGCQGNTNNPKPEPEEIIYLDDAVQKIKERKKTDFCALAAQGDSLARIKCEAYTQELAQQPKPVKIPSDFERRLNVVCCKCPEPQGECPCNEISFVYNNLSRFRPVITTENGTMVNYEEAPLNLGNFQTKKVVLPALDAPNAIITVEVAGEKLEAQVSDGKVVHVTERDQ